MALLLRRWRLQHRLEGRDPPVWDDACTDDYCVVDDVRIGRVIRRDNDPLKGCWDWFLHVTGHRDGVNIHGTASTLDEAKTAIKSEYEKWLTLNRRNRERA